MNKIICLFIVIIGFNPCFSQEEIVCGTDEYENMRIQNNPNIISIKNQAEMDIGPSTRVFATNNNAKDGILRIPVVVHLVGDNVISNISSVKVEEQITLLNDCFRKRIGSLCYGDGEDSKIEFCLANISPDGFNTNGVNQIAGYYPVFDKSNDRDDMTLKALSHWPEDEYLNIYIVADLLGAAAYATFPWLLSDKPERDGIVINMKYVGYNNTPAGEGKALTHEVGHWLGLYHTFQKGKNSNEAPCFNDDCMGNGDLICDTPPTTPTLQCPVSGNKNSCHSDVPDLNDQIENIMDYSHDACKNMFSLQQTNRMWSYFMSYRSALLNSPARCPTPNHCSNFICDGDEACITNSSLPPDCGGTDCPPCIISGGGSSPPPYCLDCSPRNNWINIYGCLKGATDGNFRHIVAYHGVNVGTDNFHNQGGRAKILVNGRGENSGSRIYLADGFKYIPGPNDVLDLKVCYLIAPGNTPKCPLQYGKPCPNNPNNDEKHYDTNFSYPDEQVSNSNKGMNSFLMLPNISTGKFTLSMDSKSQTQKSLILIHDVLGKVVFQSKINEFPVEINISSNPKGIYFIKIISENGKTDVQKVVVQ